MRRRRSLGKAAKLFEESDCMSSLDVLKDPVSGRYRIPVPLNQAWADEWLKNSVKYLEKQRYIEKHNACEEDFESEWPSIWAEWEEGSEEGEELPTKFIAILDTGYMTEHPLLQGIVEETIDLTGEGIEDQNGHGSVCALLSLGTTSHIPNNFKPRLLIIKVAGKDGRGSPENLIKGLQWLIRFKDERRIGEGELVASMSLGVYSRNWGVFRCRGGCAVCKATIEAAERGVVILTAAGNKPGGTACPARARVTEKHDNIIAAGASDYENSGVGTLVTPTGHIGFAELDM